RVIHRGRCAPSRRCCPPGIGVRSRNAPCGASAFRTLVHPPSCFRTNAAVAWRPNHQFAQGSPPPVPSLRQLRSCPTNSAETGKPACNRGSHPHSSRRAAGRRWPRGSCPVFVFRTQSWCTCGCDLRNLREQIGIKGIAIQEVVQNLLKVSLVLIEHLLRLIQRVVAVTEDVDQARVQNAVRIIILLLDAGRKVFVAVKTRRLL